MPLAEKENLQRNMTEMDGVEVLYDTFGKTKVQNASSSVDRDREMIMSLIESTVGFHTFNRHINDLLRGWVKGVILQLLENQLC